MSITQCIIHWWTFVYPTHSPVAACFDFLLIESSKVWSDLLLYKKKCQKIIYFFPTTSVKGRDCSQWAGLKELVLPWPRLPFSFSFFFNGTWVATYGLSQILVVPSTTALHTWVTCSSSKVSKLIGRPWISQGTILLCFTQWTFNYQVRLVSMLSSDLQL